MAEVPSTFTLKPGDPAPGFTLPKPDGTRVSLDDLAGRAGTLVIFACNHCPFVIHLGPALGDYARELADQGVSCVAINANDVDKYPDDAPAKMDRTAQQWGWGFPYLFDGDQSVAKAYGASCTPDFFLLDAEGKVYYTGQFDSTRPGRGGDPDGKDMRSAVTRMLRGEPPSTEAYPSSGCNIKWKPGNEPPYFG